MGRRCQYGLVAVSVLAGCLLTTGPVRAQSVAVASEDSALAETLFREGRALLEAGQISEACTKLDSSHRLDPKVSTMLNLAACHELEGRTASAWAEFLEAARLTRVLKVRDPKALEDTARTRAAALESRLHYVVVEAPDAVPAGVELFVDGRALPRAAWSSPIPVDPGERTVEARAAGRGTVSSSLLIPREGGRTALRIPSLPAEQPGAADSPRETSSPPPNNASTASPLAPVGPSPLKELPFVAGATLFVGGATVGAVFGLRAISLKNERDLECDAAGCSGAGLAKQEDARSAAVVSTVAFLVAGAGATLATVWLLLPRTKAAPMALRAGCVGATCGATLAGGF